MESKSVIPLIRWKMSILMPFESQILSLETEV